MHVQGQLAVEITTAAHENNAISIDNWRDTIVPTIVGFHCDAANIDKLMDIDWDTVLISRAYEGGEDMAGALVSVKRCDDGVIVNFSRCAQSEEEAMGQMMLDAHYITKRAN